MSERRRRDGDRQKPALREKIADAVDISKNLVLGLPLVTMVGDREMTIENYVGIIEYGDESIKIKCKAVNVALCGKDLELKTMTEEFFFITGRFKCFSFEY